MCIQPLNEEYVLVLLANVFYTDLEVFSRLAFLGTIHTSTRLELDPISTNILTRTDG